VTPSFQKDSNSFKLQVATFDKWIFPQKETGPGTKPSLLSYVRDSKLLLIKVKLFEIQLIIACFFDLPLITELQSPAFDRTRSGGRLSAKAAIA
jgi:hypothetical protein